MRRFELYSEIFSSWWRYDIGEDSLFVAQGGGLLFCRLWLKENTFEASLACPLLFLDILAKHAFAKTIIIREGRSGFLYVY